jgi:hypothetical protein
MFAGRAAEGTVLLTSFVGGLRNPELLAQSGDTLARFAGETPAPA